MTFFISILLAIAAISGCVQLVWFFRNGTMGSFRNYFIAMVILLISVVALDICYLYLYDGEPVIIGRRLIPISLFNFAIWRLAHDIWRAK